MAINVQKGLFRIYALLDVAIIIVTILLMIFEGDYWDDYLPIALLIPLPWVIHYLVKWIIKGFSDKPEPSRRHQKDKKKDREKQYDTTENSLRPKQHGRSTIVFRILIVAFALTVLPKFCAYWYHAGAGAAVFKYLTATGLKATEMTTEQQTLLQQFASAKGFKSAALMVMGYWAPFFSCLLLVTSISSPSRTPSKIWKSWLTYIALCILATGFLSAGLPTWNHSVEFPISIVSAAILWLVLGGLPAVLALILRSINKRKLKRNPDPTTTSSEKNANKSTYSITGSAGSE